MKRFLSVAFAVLITVSIFSVFASPARVSALTPAELVANSSPRKFNAFPNLVYYCSGIDSLTNTTCADYESKIERLGGGCKDPFQKASDNKYYLKYDVMQTCYGLANKYVDRISDECKQMRKDSDQWKRCEGMQDKVNYSMGCSGSLFDKGDNDRWSPDAKKLADCQARRDDAGGLSIPQPGGQSKKINASGTEKTEGEDDAANDASTGTANGDANVTCETSGFNLSWIMCPIFNGLSDASDFLLKNIVMPLLQTDALCLSPDGDGCKGNNGAIYSIWSNFRIYGNIILVIALLVIVFGEAIGGGLVDAYTVKKVLPRLLAAAILINLSIYIVAALIDITNVVGASIGQVITAPLSGEDAAFDIKPGGVQLAGAASAGIVGGFLGGASLLALFSSAGAAMLLFVLVIPAILAILGIFFTIILRNAAIVALVIVSPVAFALYCLPNTEKYFKKWWDLLTQMLLVYPIIVIVFAVSSVMSVITGGSSSTNPLNAILSFALLIIPLFMIPYAFKLAGSALGQIHGALAGGSARVNKMAEGQRERRKANFGSQVVANKVKGKDMLQARAQKYDSSTFRGRVARRTLAGAARGYGGYNPEALASAQQAATSKEIEDQIATGRDEEIRGILVDKKAALRGADGDLYRTKDDQGNEIGRQFKSLGGAWIDEAAVDAGQKRWGSDRFAKQAALQYEIRKTDGEEDVEQLANRYTDVARSTGMSQSELYGAWKGATYANAGQHLALKHMDPSSDEGQMGKYERAADGSVKVDANGNKQLSEKAISSEKAFVNEVYNKKSTSALSQMHPQSIKQLTVAHANAVARGDEETQQKIAAVAENFVSRYGAGGGMRPGEEDGAQALDPAAAAAAAAAGAGQAGGQPVQVNSFGAASVAQNVRELAHATGVLQKRTGDSQSEVPNPLKRPLY